MPLMRKKEHSYRRDCICGCGAGFECKESDGTIKVSFFSEDSAQKGFVAAMADKAKYANGDPLLREVVLTREDMQEFRQFLTECDLKPGAKKGMNSSHLSPTHLLEEMYAVWLQGDLQATQAFMGRKFSDMFSLVLSDMDRDVLVVQIDKWLEQEDTHAIERGLSPHVDKAAESIEDGENDGVEAEDGDEDSVDGGQASADPQGDCDGDDVPDDVGGVSVSGDDDDEIPEAGDGDDGDTGESDVLADSDGMFEPDPGISEDDGSIGYRGPEPVGPGTGVDPYDPDPDDVPEDDGLLPDPDDVPEGDMPLPGPGPDDGVVEDRYAGVREDPGHAVDAGTGSAGPAAARPVPSVSAPAFDGKPAVVTMVPDPLDDPDIRAWMEGCGISFGTYSGGAAAVSSQARQEPQPQARQEPQPQVRQEPQPQVRQEPQPQVRQEPQPQVRQEPQPQVRQESQPQVRQESQPQVRQEPQPQVRQEPQPQVRQEAQPQVRQEAQLADEGQDGDETPIEVRRESVPARRLPGMTRSVVQDAISVAKGNIAAAGRASALPAYDGDEGPAELPDDMADDDLDDDGDA